MARRYIVIFILLVNISQANTIFAVSMVKTTNLTKLEKANYILRLEGEIDDIDGLEILNDYKKATYSLDYELKTDCESAKCLSNIAKTWHADFIVFGTIINEENNIICTFKLFNSSNRQIQHLKKISYPSSLGTSGISAVSEQFKDLLDLGSYAVINNNSSMQEQVNQAIDTRIFIKNKIEILVAPLIGVQKFNYNSDSGGRIAYGGMISYTNVSFGKIIVDTKGVWDEDFQLHVLHGNYYNKLFYSLGLGYSFDLENLGFTAGIGFDYLLPNNILIRPQYQLSLFESAILSGAYLNLGYEVKIPYP